MQVNGWKDAVGTAAMFSWPGALAVSYGVVYVADTGNNRIRKISILRVVSTIAGGLSGFYDATGNPKH